MIKRSSPAKVVILDRDGTIVEDRHYLSDPKDLMFLPGAAEGLRSLYKNDYRLIVITNQSGVARGLFTVERLSLIHSRLHELVEAEGAHIDRIYYCPHLPGDDCNCRKPQLGLLLQAAAEFDFDPSSAIVIGDKASDVEFGRRAGAKTILISPSITADNLADFVAADLVSAAHFIENS